MMTLKTVIRQFSKTALLSGFCSIAIAQAVFSSPAALPTITPPPPKINARGYVLMDANSGKIIAEKNMNKKMPPASLTKLMTLFVASQALAQGQIHLTDPVRVSKEAWSRGGSRMFLKLGSHVTVRQLISGIIVASGNDACVALAQYVGGNETSFATLMNQSAQRIGMKNTHYVDSTGLPKPGHFSTPYDIAILTRHIIKDFPQDYSWYKQKWITYNGIKQPNRNRLLWRDPNVDGLKTGHTKAAGYCLVSSALQNNMRLISVVMGTPTDSARAGDSQVILNWGFRFYKTYKLFDANKIIAAPRVWFGENNNINVGVAQSLYTTIPNGSYAQLKATMQIQPELKAPITKGQTLGAVTLTLRGKTFKSVPLVALNNDPQSGFWGRTADHISFFFHKIF
jgi:serine-type D-Ala-D-Ala carboxypeptidase (penicillin-binding protein 5/6)